MHATAASVAIQITVYPARLGNDSNPWTNEAPVKGRGLSSSTPYIGWCIHILDTGNEYDKFLATRVLSAFYFCIGCCLKSPTRTQQTQQQRSWTEPHCHRSTIFRSLFINNHFKNDKFIGCSVFGIWIVICFVLFALFCPIDRLCCRTLPSFTRCTSITIIQFSAFRASSDLLHQLWTFLWYWLFDAVFFASVTSA